MLFTFALIFKLELQLSLNQTVKGRLARDVGLACLDLQSNLLVCLGLLLLRLDEPVRVKMSQPPVP